MTTHAYAVGRDAGGVPRFVWRFDTRALRDAAVRENASFLRATTVRAVQHHLQRAERMGLRRAVAPGITVFLLHPENAPVPAVPRLRLPPPWWLDRPASRPG